MTNILPKNRARRRTVVRVFWLTLAGTLWMLAMAAADHFAYTPQDTILTPLLVEELSGVPGKDVALVRVEYPPGGSRPVRPHHTQAITYVLDGTVVMQVSGGDPVTLRPGETFSEGPDDPPAVGRSASRTTSAKALVFVVKERDALILTSAR